MAAYGPWVYVTLTLVLAATITVCPCRAQTNNTVNDADGSIVWGELAPDDTYKTVDYTAPSGLDPYYALAISIIDTSLPETLPVDMAKDIMDGKSSIADTWQDLAKQFVGYALCIVIGLLFIIIFPIVGCCFCCCRCCGNCGGKRIQHQGPNDQCKRVAFAISLSILSLFIITGAACVYVTSDEMHKNLKGLNDSFGDATDDFNTFVDNIDRQFRRLGDTNFHYLSDVLKDYVDTASSKVSEDVSTLIKDATNLDTPLDQLSTMSSETVAEVGVLEGQVSTLEAQKTTAANDLAALNPPCGNCLDPQVAFLNALDLTQMKTKISNFKSDVSTDVFKKMKEDMDTAIETEVEAQTNNIDVVTQMDTIYNDQIAGLLDRITTFKTDMNDKASDYRDYVGDWVDLAKPYDTYRWYAGVGLAGLLGLLGLMMLVGVVLGACCSSVHDNPTERGAASNCGGICLMASVGLVFIFGALVMLVCTLMYMTGALTERYVCQSIDHMDRLEKYTKSFDVGVDLSNITFSVNGETLQLSLNNLMTDCQNDETLYTALGLKSVVDSALTKIEDFKTELDDIKSMDFSSAATDIGNTVDLSSTTATLQTVVTSIDDIKTSVTTMKSNLQGQQSAAETSLTGSGQHYDAMLSTLTSMEGTCDNLKTKATSIETTADDMQTIQIPAATDKLSNQTFMEGLISQVTDSFIDTIFGFVDSYINDIRTKLANDVGKCTPFYSILNAILGEAVCHGIMDPLNGFWLALGWCLFFFMPSLILAVKLAKHYRTMLYEDSYDSTTDHKPPPPYYTQSSAPPKATIFPPIHGPNNKVAPF
ncbi:prominin-1-A-like [Babylonia areolata]|uniref:prominin-1-A-like n=1 Tax=Babylonia areolata TaxID=304850 RepID=UPI003FCF396A